MITEFRGENFCYSNFYRANQVAVIQGLGPVIFPTNEHFYAFMKPSRIEQSLEILKAPKPGIAKRMAGPKGYIMPNGELFKIELRPNWNDVRIGVMSMGLTLKFTQNEDLRKVLVASHPKMLQEGNWWGDTFWGVCLKTGIGENNLGKLLMDLRLRFILESMPVQHQLII